uniref:PIP49_C domain-containing protein n=1 Tax=Anopheles minimus TaxID=112268 RepID=A0A182W897_9DIPT
MSSVVSVCRLVGGTKCRLQGFRDHYGKLSHGGMIKLSHIIVLQRFPNEHGHTKTPLEAVCEYDSRTLCPECFTKHTKCDNFDKLFVPHAESFFNRINSISNSHMTRIGTFSKSNNLAVLKHINRDNAIEKLLSEFCEFYSQPNHSCTSWKHDGSTEEAKQFIKESILDSTRIEGCIFCPTTGSRQALQRFLDLFNSADNELWHLLAIRTNVEPLLLKLFATRNTTVYVPKLLGTVGFSFIESYDGRTLEHYYDHPLATRVLIAAELIKAAFSFTEGIHGFRIYLTDINPDNVVVHVGNDGRNVKVSIVDLDNVIILDSRDKTFSTHQNAYHVQGRIECDRCFAYVQEDICRYRNSDLNLFATCQLLLENQNGKYGAGLLHYDHSKDLDQRLQPQCDETAQILHNLLEEACRGTFCKSYDMHMLRSSPARLCFASSTSEWCGLNTLQQLRGYNKIIDLLESFLVEHWLDDVLFVYKPDFRASATVTVRFHSQQFVVLLSIAAVQQKTADGGDDVEVIEKKIFTQLAVLLLTITDERNIYFTCSDRNIHVLRLRIEEFSMSSQQLQRTSIVCINCAA